jgi:hypothetical protein
MVECGEFAELAVGAFSLKVEEMDPAKMVRISGPTVSFRGNVASPSRLPWVTLNGWRYLLSSAVKGACASITRVRPAATDK